MDEQQTNNASVGPDQSANISGGNPTGNNIPTNTDANVPNMSQPQGPAAPRKSLLKKLLLVLLILALIGGGYYAYAHYFKNTTNKTETSTVTAKKDITLIRHALADGPINALYPAADSSDGSLLIDAQVFEGLVGYQDSTKSVPLLATSWTNPNDSTWLFKLKTGVKFHTGRTMTAADVKFSIDSYKDVAFGGEFGSTIKSVTVVAPDEVKITTDGPDPILLHRLVYLYIVDSKSTKKEDAINGTGPYNIKAAKDPKSKDIDLVAFDDYHGGHVYAREVLVSLADTEKAVLPLLKSKKIDLFYGFFNTANSLTAKSDGATITPEKTTTVTLLGLNNNVAPLNNLKIRQALNTGLDKAAIFKANSTEGTPLDQFVTQSIPGYDTSLIALPTDVAKAKKLVAESGIKNPTFTVLYSSDLQKAVAEIKRQAALFGITVNLSPQTDFGKVIDVIFDGKGQAYYAGYSPDFNDASDTFSNLFQGGCYKDPAVDKLMKQANQELDGSKRVATLQQVAKILNSDTAAVAIGNKTQYSAATNTSYVLHRDLPTSNIGVYFWKTYQQ